MNPSDASEDIDLTNNAAKQNLSKQSAQTPTEPRDNFCTQKSLIPSDASEEIEKNCLRTFSELFKNFVPDLFEATL
ncbi:hypothetical protein DPMN_005358 [Dreissena polymorpha]|uniref:Uncharacterized protein n=1 Tax=Dreissena polymorpha TaxID=45954 RepID=A0A9D4RWR5_DREPO|nr:hypothetical protein DPMN_005358 [Dreissena polymorpha]